MQINSLSVYFTQTLFSGYHRFEKVKPYNCYFMFIVILCLLHHCLKEETTESL